MKEKITWAVSTDLDGTFLNHSTYSFKEALPALSALNERSIPVIFNTSKTYSETASLQKETGVNGPFIVENGSCLYIPEDFFERYESEAPRNAEKRNGFYEIITGRRKKEVRNIIDAVSDDPSALSLLSDCTAEEASDLTGLSLQQAEGALMREFSEPFIWKSTDGELDIFIAKLHENGLTVVRGGRFYHAIGQCSKKTALDAFKKLLPNPVRIAALGDSPNDAEMLSGADFSVIVSSPSSFRLEAMVESYYKTKKEAPEGWSEGIWYFLNSIKEDP